MRKELNEALEDIVEVDSPRTGLRLHNKQSRHYLSQMGGVAEHPQRAAVSVSEAEQCDIPAGVTKGLPGMMSAEFDFPSLQQVYRGEKGQAVYSVWYEMGLLPDESTGKVKEQAVNVVGEDSSATVTLRPEGVAYLATVETGPSGLYASLLKQQLHGETVTQEEALARIIPYIKETCC